MAETHSKRQREETQVVVLLLQQQEHAHQHDEGKLETKRCKSSPTPLSPYNEILSLLEVEEDIPSNQDVSSFITTLQEEISSDSNNNVGLDIDDLDFDPLTCTSTGGGGGEDCSSASSSFSSSSSPHEDGEDDERERVMRHLLQASDDELGLPSVENGVEDRVLNGGEVLNFGDNLWELEDETANYYTLLQSELFSCE